MNRTNSMPKSVLGCSKDKGQYFGLEISLTNYSTPYTIHGWYVCFFFQLNLLPSYLASFIDGSFVLVLCLTIFFNTHLDYSFNFTVVYLCESRGAYHRLAEV